MSTVLCRWATKLDPDPVLSRMVPFWAMPLTRNSEWEKVFREVAEKEGQPVKGPFIRPEVLDEAHRASQWKPCTPAGREAEDSSGVPLDVQRFRERAAQQVAEKAPEAPKKAVLSYTPAGPWGTLGMYILEQPDGKQFRRSRKRDIIRKARELGVAYVDES